MRTWHRHTLLPLPAVSSPLVHLYYWQGWPLICQKVNAGPQAEQRAKRWRLCLPHTALSWCSFWQPLCPLPCERLVLPPKGTNLSVGRPCPVVTQWAPRQPVPWAKQTFKTTQYDDPSEMRTLTWHTKLPFIQETVFSLNWLSTTAELSYGHREEAVHRATWKTKPKALSSSTTEISASLMPAGSTTCHQMQGMPYTYQGVGGEGPGTWLSCSGPTVFKSPDVCWVWWHTPLISESKANLINILSSRPAKVTQWDLFWKS